MIRNLKNRRVRRKIDPATDNPVQHGLAYTPAKMKELSDKGIPVSTMTVDDMFFDGDFNTDFNVPIEEQRGLDMSEAWEAEQDAKQAFLNGLKKDIQNYG